MARLIVILVSSLISASAYAASAQYDCGSVRVIKSQKRNKRKIVKTTFDAQILEFGTKDSYIDADVCHQRADFVSQQDDESVKEIADNINELKAAEAACAFIGGDGESAELVIVRPAAGTKGYDVETKMMIVGKPSRQLGKVVRCK